MVILLPLLTHTLEVSRRRVHQQNTVLFAPRRNLADWTVILKSVIIAPKETMGGTFIASPVDEHWSIIKLFVVSICFISFLVLFNARCIDFVQWEQEHPNIKMIENRQLIMCPELKYVLIDSFQGSAGSLDSAANCTTLHLPNHNLDWSQQFKLINCGSIVFRIN